MSEEFHSYTPEDRFLTRGQRARLESLEAGAAELCAPFVAAHRTALALSFGKDSMVALHVLHRAGILAGCTIVMWNNSGIETADTLAMRDYVMARYPLTNYVETEPDADTLERTLQMTDVRAKHPIRYFVYECLEQPRWRMMDTHQIDGTILGLRSEESNARRMHIARRGTEYWNRREKAMILLPLANWSTADVFRYMALHKVPLHPVYHRMAALGFERHRIRLSTPADVAVKEYGQVAALKRLYPETYRRYVSLAPEIATFA